MAFMSLGNNPGQRNPPGVSTALFAFGVFVLGLLAGALASKAGLKVRADSLLDRLFLPWFFGSFMLGGAGAARWGLWMWQRHRRLRRGEPIDQCTLCDGRAPADEMTEVTVRLCRGEDTTKLDVPVCYACVKKDDRRERWLKVVFRTLMLAGALLGPLCVLAAGQKGLAAVSVGVLIGCALSAAVWGIVKLIVSDPFIGLLRSGRLAEFLSSGWQVEDIEYERL